MERTRHMVEIADDSWNKLERLAHRLGNAQYVYKGRPRYGKLIELAIEKLEDSTMEWTEEEVEWGDEIPELNYDNGIVPTSESYDIPAYDNNYIKSNPNFPVKLAGHGAQAPKDMALYGNSYVSADTGSPVKASSVSFKVSADDTSAKQLEKLSETLKDLNKGMGASTKPIEPPNIDPDLLKETTEAVAAAMNIQLEKQVKEAIVSGKDKKIPQVTWETKNWKTNQDETKGAELFLYVTAKLDDTWSVQSIILDAIADFLSLKYIANSNIKHFVKSISAYQDTQGRTIFLVELDNLSTQASLMSLAMYPVKAIEKYLKATNTWTATDTPMLDAFKKNAFVGMDYAASAANEASKSTAKLAQAFKEQEQAAQGYNNVATDPNIITHTKVNTNSFENGSVVVVLSCELTQAMSANQQSELRNYIWQSAKKYIKQPTGVYPLDECYMKNVPWNKLYIDFTYQPGTVLITTLNVVAHNLRMTLENWLLSRNLIGPLPQAVNIAEKKPDNLTKYDVSWSFKPENKIDENSVMQLRDVHTFVVSQGFLLENHKFDISEHIKDEVSKQYGYGSTKYLSSTNKPEVTWWLNGKTLLIKVSVKRKTDTPAMFSIQKVGDAVTEYLLKKLEVCFSSHP